uniref:Uncharacterized protein n=1 Tax=Avena sativa TaxID=4498 RepID=A0ACD5XY86_AVESA
MAKRSATPVIARRRAKAVTLPRNVPHRFLRLLAASPKIARRRQRQRQRSLIAVPSSFRPPLGNSEKPRCAIQSRTPSPTHEAETPQKPKRPEPPHEESPDVAAAAAAGKYWAHRHSLFTLYDRGVRMDAEGWYSATPESIAAAQAARAAPAGLVVDAFAGVGGNSIQFAARGCYVIAVEIDPCKVQLARHNARIYGVEDMIEFVVGDFFRLAPSLKADLVFLSPPWGGPSYYQAPIYTLDMLKPKDGYTLFQAAQKIARDIIMFLPRNVDIVQVEELSWLCSPPLDFEV